MTLPSPARRRHLHTRQIVFRSYLRDDGLWDIEAELADSKTYAFELHDRGTIQPDELIHGMAIRVTIDDAMVVKDIQAVMPHVPFPQCTLVVAPMQAVIGLKMGAGWRGELERAIGGTMGCTHLRELLFNIATAAYQTIPSYRHHEGRMTGGPVNFTESPLHLGKCMTWAVDGDATSRFLPDFAVAQDSDAAGDRAQRLI
jgi:hypothetical protein